ncbi:DegT/DnrJ/EryC1/StrS family aminotransferase [Heyndrickxia sporothermodurans]|uniref:DegT/DnrJ/EryC1/StrS family aminotransferase n=1 Tax=Heyndrickxia sporothermodurans TaxID=46224 RepID=UPI0035DC3327
MEIKVKYNWPQWPIYSQSVREELHNVLDSNRWAVSGYWTGEECKEKLFAMEYAKYNNTKYCVPTTSGTNALLIALEALGVGYGDEVLVPALTWLATASVVLNVNAKPVLVDVDPESYCMDWRKIEELITSKTKAIIPVHLYGSVCDMDEIMRIAKKHNLYVIEDCAQSHGSEWNGKKVGTIGHLGCFSFQQAKVLTAGEGGAVITNDYEVKLRLEQLRADGRVLADQNEAVKGSLQLIEVGKIQGSNRCLSEFQAAILIEQLKLLENQNDYRQQAAEYLDNELLKIPGIKVQERPISVNKQTYYSYIIKIDQNEYPFIDARDVVNKLQEKLVVGDFHIHSPRILVVRAPSRRISS